MIKRVKISGYKSFRDLSLELRPLTVIFGPNASGKSNFLDALYLFSSSINSPIFFDDVQEMGVEVFKGHRGLPLESFYYGDEGYEALLQKPEVHFTFEADFELSPTVIKKVEERARELRRRSAKDSEKQKKIITERYLRYFFTIEAFPETGHLRSKDERLCAIKRNGEEKKRKLFFDEGRIPPLRPRATDSFAFHLSAFLNELLNWHTYYLEPKVLMREEVPLADIEVLGPRGENLAAFLNTLKHKYEKDFESFNLALKLLLPTRPTVDIDRDKEGRVALRIHENGLSFSAHLISEGTLRIIGLLAAIHPRNPATVVAFEEPENGVHPARLRTIAEALKNAAYEYGKQIIVTTHSPFLIEYFDVKDLFVCYREGKQSTIKPLLSYAPDFKGRRGKRALADRILRGDFGR